MKIISILSFIMTTISFIYMIIEIIIKVKKKRK